MGGIWTAWKEVEQVQGILPAWPQAVQEEPTVL